MNKKDVVDIVNDEIKKFAKDSLDKEVADLLKKSNSKTRDELIGIIKDSLEAAFKVLWVKKDFWKKDIK